MNLEELIIKFLVDAAQAKKENIEVKKTTDDVKDSVEKVDKASKKADKSLQNLAKSFKNTILKYASIGAIVFGVKSATAYTLELSKVSKALDVNVEDLDAWGQAVKTVGGTAEGFQGSLEKTKIKLSEFPKLAEKFSQMSKTKAFEIGAQIGLDEGTIRLLQRGRREVDAIIARQKELGVVTKRDAEIAEKFNQQWDASTRTFQSLFRAVGSEVLPVLTRLIEGFGSLVNFFKNNTQHAKSLGVAVAAIAAGLFPITAIVFGIGAAFALAYEDLMVFLEGGDSFIGEVIERFPIVVTIFKAISAAISHVVKYFKEAGEVVGYIAGLIGKLFGSGDKKLDVAINTGKEAIDTASSSKISSQTSNSIASSSRVNNKTTSVQTGPITIQTQATDSEGIAGAFSDSLKREISQTVGNFDDGVLA